MTERRRIAELMGNQAKMAALGRVAAGVAHEVGNPLSSISALIQLIARRGTTKDSEIDSLRTNIRRIEEIVRTVRGFSVPARRDAEPVALDQVIGEALRIVGLDPRWEHVEVRLDFGPGPLLCSGSFNQLLQVFLNLLLNAADAMGGAGTVHVGASRLDDSIEASVRDSGPGLEPGVESRLFEPFFTTKSAGDGTGVGLNVSWNIVTDHGGTIDACNHRKGGAMFVVRIPATDATDATEVAS